jgi:hypothetical protein
VTGAGCSIDHATALRAMRALAGHSMGGPKPLLTSIATPRPRADPREGTPAAVSHRFAFAERSFSCCSAQAQVVVRETRASIGIRSDVDHVVWRRYACRIVHVKTKKKQNASHLRLIANMTLCRIPLDKTTQQPIGHAFVHFHERSQAVNALSKFQGVSIDAAGIDARLMMRLQVTSWRVRALPSSGVCRPVPNVLLVIRALPMAPRFRFVIDDVLRRR